MFFVFAILSAVGHAAQQVFLTKYAREMDGLSLTIYRNTSFIITMLPFLLLASPEHFSRLPQFAPQILLGGFFGALYLMLQFVSYRYIPVGLAAAFIRSSIVVGSILLGFFLFQETLSVFDLACIALILIGVLYLGFIKNTHAHLDNNMIKGALFSIIPGFILALSYYFMSAAARGVDPFIVGYFWEVSIGLFAIGFGIIRFIVTGVAIHYISVKKYLHISCAALPTLIGTGCLALAVSMGPLGLASGIAASGVIIAALMAHFLFREKLHARQWIGIAIVVSTIALLKIYG